MASINILVTSVSHPPAAHSVGASGKFSLMNDCLQNAIPDRRPAILFPGTNL